MNMPLLRAAEIEILKNVDPDLRAQKICARTVCGGIYHSMDMPDPGAFLYIGLGGCDFVVRQKLFQN